MLEEEIKVKVVLPYLEDLGFGIEDLSLEKTFSVRLGTKTQEISDSFNSIGRLDILCKQQDQNLFVIEVKREELSITQDDIDQGVSYARLLDQIAPFVIVTNGHDTKVVDTITKQELSGTKLSTQSEFWRNDCRLATKEELDIRFNALKHFVHFSEDNLRVFCGTQVESRMSTLIGMKYDLKAKYVEELHVLRKEINEEFSKFLESDKQVFAIVGESGSGKSAAICNLCISYSAGNQFAVFYNGTLISKPLLEMICSDLNIFFSARSEKDEILSKLEFFASDFDNPIVFFIDAIDEVVCSNFALELSDLSITLNSISNIRLCISCKKAVWNRFLERNAVPTHLYANVYTPKDIEETQGKYSYFPGVELSVFNRDELTHAIEKYREAFNIKGDITDYQRRFLCNPLLLRLACTVFQNDAIPANAQYNELFSRYLQFVAVKADLDYDSVIMPVLKKLAEIQLGKEKDGTTYDCYVSANELCSELGLLPLTSLPEPIFSHSLLLRERRDEHTVVLFNQTLLRDYIICFHVLRLHEKSNQELEEVLPDLCYGSVGLGALYYYSCNAHPDHLEIIFSNARMNALQYVTRYDEYLDYRYRNLKSRFEPYTDGPIGMIVVDSDITHTGPYALFPLKNVEDAEKLVVLNQEEAHKDKTAYLKYGATTLHFSMSGFLSGSIEDAVEENIKTQLQGIIEKGLLVEGYSELLLREKIASIIFYYWNELGNALKLGYRKIPRMDQIYPIDLHEIRNKMQREFAKVHFRKQQVHELIGSGRVKKSGNSYLVDNNDIDQEKLTSDIEEALNRGVPIPEPQRNESYPPWVDLNRAVCRMIDAGYNILEEHYLPSPDVPLEEYTDPISLKPNQIDWNELCILNQFTPEHLESYISEFFGYIDVVYKEMVEFCLPYDKDLLEFYMSIPHRFTVILPCDDPNPPWRFTYGYSQSPSGESEVRILHEDLAHKEVWERFQQLGADTCYLRDISCIMYDSSPIGGSGFFLGTSNRKIDSTRMLRNWVYELLLEEIKSIP